MSLANYQLIKELDWYYLARKRFVLTNYINAVDLNSALVELSKSELSIPPAPPFTVSPRGDKPYSLSFIKTTTGESTDETKHVRNISPLVLNTKEKVFDIGSEIIGRSSPVTVKPTKGDNQADDSVEKKKDDRKPGDRKSGVFVEGMNLESGFSLRNRRKSKELVLKVKKASSDSLESAGLRKSQERIDAGVSVTEVKTDTKAIPDSVDSTAFVDHGKTEQLEAVQSFHDQQKADKKVVAEPDSRTSSLDKAELDNRKTSLEKSVLSVHDQQEADKKVVAEPDSRKSSLDKAEPDNRKTSLDKAEPDNRKSSLDKAEPDSRKSGLDKVDHQQVDKKVVAERDSRTSSLDKAAAEHSSEGETRRSSDTSESKLSEDSPSVASHSDGTHATPLMTDVSIQLTKTDGRSENYRAPSDVKLALDVDNSFDIEDPEYEGILKRCSSFAGFRSETACGTIKPEDESLSQAHSPVKGVHPILAGPLGRLRHFSAPLSGQGTPKSRVSTLPQTPSWVSSRGSFTEDGKISF